MNKYRSLRIILPILLAILIFMLLHIHAVYVNRTAPAIKGGIMDLQDWDERQNPSFKLSGEWEFYPDQLLDQNTIHNAKAKCVLVQVPFESDRMDINGKRLPVSSTGTYRIHVINTTPGCQLAVQIRQLTEAYRLYADGQLIAANGQLTDDSSALISNYRYQFAAFTPDKGDFDIILQVANQFDNKGELQWPLVFGVHDAVAGVYHTLSAVDLISVGSLLTICLFCLILWGILPKEKELLILCFLGIVVLLHIIISEDLLIADLLPRLSVINLNQIDYVLGYGMVFLYFVLTYAIFPSLFPRWSIRLYSGCLLAVSIWLGVNPAFFFSSTGVVFDIIQLLVFVASAFMICRAALENRPGASAMLGLMGCTVACLLYCFTTTDISMVYYLLNGTGLAYLAVFLVMGTIIAQRFKTAQNMAFNALRGQIRPHFIHNALASIISISRREPDRSRELLVDFSTYLRGSFDYTARDLISFEQELELVNAYIELEQARFGNKYTVQYQLEAENFLMPPLILQPLVENALVHGLRDREAGGIVVIYSVRKKNKVSIGIRDNGAGMCEKNNRTKLRQGIGIKNINQRLYRLYGSQLHFQVPPGGGCDVYLEIPYKEAGPK